MNKVILTGRFTRDPESRMTQSNLEISRFSLACQGEYVSRTGERDVEFVNCVAFNRLAGTINKFCRKGSLVGVQGRIRNNSYEAQDGTKRYNTEIVIEQLEFLGARGDNQGAPVASSNSNAYSPSGDVSSNVETTDIGEDPYKDFGEEYTLSSDDLPF